MASPKRFCTVLLILLMSSVAVTLGSGSVKNVMVASLDGLREVPAVITEGHGEIKISIDRSIPSMEYTLTYSDLEGEVTQVHIHIGQRGANGGVAAFLCSNLGTAPAGTPECPPSPGTLIGTIAAEDVIAGAAGQGVGEGELDDLMRAIAKGAAYVNVHTDRFEGGEIRGQFGGRIRPNFTAPVRLSPRR